MVAPVNTHTTSPAANRRVPASSVGHVPPLCMRPGGWESYPLTSVLRTLVSGLLGFRRPCGRVLTGGTSSARFSHSARAPEVEEKEVDAGLGPKEVAERKSNLSNRFDVIQKRAASVLSGTGESNIIMGGG